MNKILYRKVTLIIILVPKIYILPPQKGLEFAGGGGFCKTKMLKKCIKLNNNWNFHGGGRIILEQHSFWTLRMGFLCHSEYQFYCIAVL